MRELLIEYSKEKTKQLATIQALLSKRVFDESLFKKIYPFIVESTDTNVLFTLLQAIINNYGLHQNHKEKVTYIINRFTDLGFYSWSSVYYLSNDFWKEVSDENIKAILENLKYCNDIGYCEESVLSSIGEKKPKDIIQFFHERLNLSKAKKISNPIPFKLFYISDSLSKNSKEILPEIIKWFSDDDPLANWHASSLINNIFPSFNSDLERILLTLVKGCDKKDLRIVFHILNKYGGKPFIHETIKEIIKTHTLDEKLKANLYHNLSAVKEVTMGDYGFYDALKLKKEETKDWLTDPNAKIRDFVVEYQKFLDTRIKSEKDRVDKEITFRKREFEVAHK